MGLRTESRLLGNHRYSVTTCPASEGRRILVKLLKLLGPTLAPILSGVDTKGLRARATIGTGETGEPVGWSVLDMEGKTLAEALQEFSSRLSSELVEDLAATFGACSEVHLGGERALQLTLETQEEHFSGNYSEFTKWIAFALEVNFKDFLGVLPLSRKAKAADPNAADLAS